MLDYKINGCNSRVLEPDHNNEIFIDEMIKHGSYADRSTLQRLENCLDFSYVDSILDVGCGPGFLCNLLAKKYPDKFVKGIDLSEKAIKYAKKYQNTLPNIAFEVQDVNLLTEPSNIYDLVICNSSLHHFIYPYRAVSQMLRVTKERKLTIIYDFCRDVLEDDLKEIRQMELNGSVCTTLSDSLKASLSLNEYSDLADYFFENFQARPNFRIFNGNPGSLASVCIVELVLGKTRNCTY